MSTLKIEERIVVDAPVERVWRFLLDPAEVARCLPGAQLDGSEGERTYLGRMKVKVGPVLTEFKGKATLTEIDEAGRRVVLTGTGEDKSGGGSARLVMHSQVEPTPEGGSAITIVADVDIAGKLVRMGRGMIEGISKQLFKQFAERARAHLLTPAEEKAAAPAEETAAAPAEEKAAAPAEEKAAAPTEETAAAPAEEKAAAPAASEMGADAGAAAAGSSEAAAAPEAPEAAQAAAPPVEESATPTASAAVVQPAAAPASLQRTAPPADNAPLDAGSLVWAALWDWIKRLFRRLLGRR